jgi:hypothetical protein
MNIQEIVLLHYHGFLAAQQLSGMFKMASAAKKSSAELMGEMIREKSAINP